MAVFIDAQGERGNAFYIVNAVRKHLREAGVDDKTISSVSHELMSTSYAGLCRLAEVYTDNGVQIVNRPKKQDWSKLKGFIREEAE